MNIRHFFFAFFLLSIAAVLPATGINDENTGETGEIVRVTGLVRLTGTSLFPGIVISASAAENWYIPEEWKNLLHDLQHRVVTVEGEEVLVPLDFGGGRRTLVRRELRNIRIISVHK